MTTSPVLSITDEMLAELDHAEKTHLDGEVRDMARGALLHIRSLTERLKAAEKDAARYRYFRDAGLPNGLGLYDDELDAEIDQQIAEVAAIAQEGQSHE